MSRAPRRLACESVSFRLGACEKSVGHPITVNLGYDNGRLVEIAFCEAGKIGHGLQLIFAELGLRLSRAIQHRDPETGAPVS